MAKRKRRSFTPEFKAEADITSVLESALGGRSNLSEALSGESSQAELCRRHNLSE